MEHRIAITRQARYYTAGDPSTASDLWIVIHGYGQLASAFLKDFEPLVTSSRAFVAPEALNRFYMETDRTGGHGEMPVGATWMTREDRDAEIADYIAYLDAVERATRPAGACLGVLGFSQGVATQMRWLAARGTPADRVVTWAGQVPPELDLVGLRSKLPAAGVEFVQGTRDKFATWAGIETQVARFTEAGIATRVTSFEGGHRLDDATLRDVVER